MAVLKAQVGSQLQDSLPECASKSPRDGTLPTTKRFVWNPRGKYHGNFDPAARRRSRRHRCSTGISNIRGVLACDFRWSVRCRCLICRLGSSGVRVRPGVSFTLAVQRGVGNNFHRDDGDLVDRRPVVRFRTRWLSFRTSADKMGEHPHSRSVLSRYGPWSCHLGSCNDSRGAHGRISRVSGRWRCTRCGDCRLRCVTGCR